MEKTEIQKRTEEVIKDVERPPSTPTYKLSRAARKLAEKRLGIRPKK